MPQIPVYQPGQVRAAPISGQNIGVQASADSFGRRQAQGMAAVGAGLTDAGNLLLQLRAKEKEKDDRVAAGALYNQAALDAQKAMQEGVYAKEGNAASDSEATAQTAMQGIRQSYMAKAKGARQQELFAASFDNLAANNMGDAVNHWGKQRKVAEEINRSTMNQMAIEGTTRAAMENDPALADKLAQSEQVLTANTKAQYSVDPALGELKAKEAVGLLHQNLAASLTKAGRYDDALNLLQANKSKLPPEVAAKVENDILDKKQQGVVMGMVQNGATEDQIAAHVMSTVKDPGKADDLVRYANTFLAVKKHQQAAAATQQQADFWKAMDNAKTPEDRLSIYEQNKDSLGHNDRKEAMALIQKGGNDEGIPDLGKYRELAAMNGADLLNRVQSPGAYREVQAALGGPKSPFWNDIEAKIREAGGGKAAPGEKDATAHVLSDLQRNSAAFNQAYKGKLSGDDYKRAEGAFMSEYEKRAVAAAKQSGKPLGIADKDAIVMRMLVTGKIDSGHWYSSDTPAFAFQADAQGQGKSFIPDIPAAVAAAVPPNADIRLDPATGNFGAVIAGKSVQVISPDGKLIGKEIPLAAADAARRQGGGGKVAGDAVRGGARVAGDAGRGGRVVASVLDAANKWGGTYKLAGAVTTQELKDSLGLSGGKK